MAYTLKSFLQEPKDGSARKDRKKLEKKTPGNRFMGGSSTYPPGVYVHEGLGKGLLAEIVAPQEPAAQQQQVRGLRTHQKAQAAVKPGGKQKKKGAKYAAAQGIFNQMLNREDAERMDILQAFMDKLGVTKSTATSYYQRLAKDAGITGSGDGSDMEGEMSDDDEFGTDEDEMDPDMAGDVDVEEEPVEQQEWNDPNRQGIIRTVDGSHLVFKRQSEDGTFEELWVYKLGDDFNRELDVRRDILAGTDIPKHKTKSPDSAQSYSIITMGDAQLLLIKGLPQ